MITYTEEPLAHCKPDIEALLPAQWAETGDSAIECAPDWNMYSNLERVKALILIMARDDNGRAVGYLAGVVHRHPNSVQHQVASLATYFIEDRPGRPLLVRSLLANGVKVATQRGAWKITIDTEHDHSAARILEAMGFKPKSVKYVMTRDVQEAAHA